MRPRAAGLLTILTAAAAGCASESEPPAPTPTVVGPVALPPPETTSDRGDRSLPVSPIGRIAPEVAPPAR